MWSQAANQASFVDHFEFFPVRTYHMLHPSVHSFQLSNINRAIRISIGRHIQKHNTIANTIPTSINQSVMFASHAMGYDMPLPYCIHLYALGLVIVIVTRAHTLQTSLHTIIRAVSACINTQSANPTCIKSFLSFPLIIECILQLQSVRYQE